MLRGMHGVLLHWLKREVVHGDGRQTELEVRVGELMTRAKARNHIEVVRGANALAREQPLYACDSISQPINWDQYACADSQTREQSLWPLDQVVGQSASQPVRGLGQQHTTSAREQSAANRPADGPIEQVRGWDRRWVSSKAVLQPCINQSITCHKSRTLIIYQSVHHVP